MVYPRQILYIKNILSFFKIFNKNKNNIKIFQKIFHKKFDTKKVIPISMGRFGIYLACNQISKINKNEIILSPFTIFDIVNMILCSKSKPVFCDIEKKSNHLSLSKLKSKINRKTAAIIITHYETINPEIKKIYSFCKKRNIYLINDLAIAIDSKLDKNYIYKYSDFAIYSFGFYKFISSLYGGSLFVKNSSMLESIKKQVLKFPAYSFSDLFRQIIKYIAINFFTQKNIFSFIVFPIFKFGFFHNLNIINKFTKNDPNPFINFKLKEDLFKNLNSAQINSIRENFKNLEKQRLKRKKNYIIYQKNLKDLNITLNYNEKLQGNSSFINFTILCKNKKDLKKYLMSKGFDLSQYFYRDCSSLKVFKKYGSNLKNIKDHVDKLLFLPTHHKIPTNYAKNLSSAICKYYENR